MLIALRSAAALMMGLIGTVFVAETVSAPSKGAMVERAPDRTGPEISPWEDNIVFTHGDISWLPALAAEAGWPEETWRRLGYIILRESGGCPNRRGGDRVDKNCNIVEVTEWNHRSDTGLLQINGIHYDQTRDDYVGLVCKRMNVCTQEELLDPLTNLRAGRLLFAVAGWQPWTPQKKTK